jgi:signal recognition particle subunit SRP54
MAALGNMMGFGGGMPSPEQMKELAEKMPGGLPQGAGGLPGLPKDFPGGALPPGGLPGLPGLGNKLPGLGGFPGLPKGPEKKR